jgi:zinc D-Ala-D-Ala carboxypeptidase
MSSWSSRRAAQDASRAADGSRVSIDAAVTRISQIQSQLLALQAHAPATSTRASATAAAGAAASGSFARHLSEALATQSPAASPVPSTGKAHRLNSDGIPTTLAAFGNGRVPSSALREVGATGHRLWEPAAGKLTELIGDARRAGVHIGITDSYRSYEAQVDVARRKGLYSQGGLAAVPGTSDHGWGMAVDLDLDARAQAWMREHGPAYGFHEDTPREPWHWGFKPPSPA